MKCPECRRDFIMPNVERKNGAYYTTCPNCGYVLAKEIDFKNTPSKTLDKITYRENFINP